MRRALAESGKARRAAFGKRLAQIKMRTHLRGVRLQGRPYWGLMTGNAGKIVHEK